MLSSGILCFGARTRLPTGTPTSASVSDEAKKARHKKEGIIGHKRETLRRPSLCNVYPQEVALLGGVFSFVASRVTDEVQKHFA